MWTLDDVPWWMLLQQSENERNELRQVFQVENAVFVMRFMWCSNDRLQLKITARLRMCEGGDRVKLSTVMHKLSVWFWGGIRHQSLSYQTCHRFVWGSWFAPWLSLSDEGLEDVCVSSTRTLRSGEHAECTWMEEDQALNPGEGA